MLPHWLFSQHKAKYSPSSNTLDSVFLLPTSSLFERIVNTCFFCFPVSISLLDHCVWLLCSMTFLVGHGTSNFHSGPFSFSFAGSSFPSTLNSGDPQDSAKNPLGLFLVYLLSLRKLSPKL